MSGRHAGEGIGDPLQYSSASLVAQLVKCLPEMPETWILSLGWEDTLEKGNGWRPGFNSWVGKISWRKGLPTPVFWLGEFHGLSSPWGHKELDTTEPLSLTLFLRVRDKHSLFVNNFCSVNAN